MSRRNVVLLVCDDISGRTDIGTVDAEILPDLIIQGTGVEDDHCYIVI
jgi:hypothetical protein